MRSCVLLASLALVLSSCSNVGVQATGNSVLNGGGGKLKDEPRPVSPEEDVKAPGMIPQECEALLNKSQEWGVVGNNWKPAAPAQALEAVTFFSTFHLVPESTSNFARAWLSETPPQSDAAAQKSIDRMDRAQSCDLMLAHQELLALVKYKWTRKDKPIAAAALHRFVLNQQTRVAPSMARAVHLNVLRKAEEQGLIKVNRREVTKLQKWFDEETAKGLKRAEEVISPKEQWALHKDELRLSEEARERLSKLLPLP